MAVALVATFALLGAACSSDSDSSTTSTTSSSSGSGASDEIKKVQEDLNAVGCRAGEVDGEMGPHTEDALKAFQAAKGLTESGEADAATTEALAAAVTAGETVCTTPVTVATTTTVANATTTTAGGDVPTLDFTVDPATAATGDTITISATGCSHDGTAGTLWYGVGPGVDGGDPTGQLTVESDGSASTTYEIPSGGPTGAVEITGECWDDSSTAIAKYEGTVTVTG
jgi:peptidoglycan hydrolase-like protein with peptidoglycan-binding domain